MQSLRRAALVAVLVTVGVGISAGPAQAGTGRGPEGQVLTVTPSAGLSRAGTTVTVKGSGYDVAKGIYVAFCVDNGAGAMPTPCGGGADTTGSLGASHWISSKPPSYAEGLTVPYGPGGTFQVRLKVPTAIGSVDCTTRRCVVASRADHTRTSDRSQDVRVPITFAAAAAAPAPTRSSAAPAGATGSGTGTGGVGRAPASGPAAPPAGSAPAAAPPGAPVAGSAAAPQATASTADLQVSRVSAASGTGRWWSVALVVLALGVVALLGLRWRRQRRATR